MRTQSTQYSLILKNSINTVFNAIRYLSYGTLGYLRIQFRQYLSENSGHAMLPAIRNSFQTLLNTALSEQST